MVNKILCEKTFSVPTLFLAKNQEEFQEILKNGENKFDLKKINLMIKMRSRVILINFNVNLLWNIDLEANRWRWLTFIIPWEKINIVNASENSNTKKVTYWVNIICCAVEFTSLEYLID